MLNALTLHKKVNNKKKLNMKKKLTQLRWLVTMLLLVTAMAMPKMAWAGITPTQPSIGDGTSANPYQIGTAAELYWFAALVNGTNGLTQNLAANAILTQNITINQNVLLDNGEFNSESESSFEKWTPIGYTSDENYAYTGTFDGNGNTISGLYYSEDTSVKTYAGLFGYNKGTISNITIKDSRFYLSSSVNFSSVAAIVGRNDGTVKYCYNTCTINGTATATHYVGGICGYNKNQITNCDNCGIVNCTYAGEVISMIGGICGVSNGKITDCNNAGKVSVESNGEARVGGVCGSNYKGGTTENCHNTADVNVSGNTTESCAGGVCGYNFLGTDNLTSTISNCSNAGNITGISHIGGVCGTNSCEKLDGAVIVINCYNTGTVSGTSYVGGVCGYIKYEKGQIINCYNTGTVIGSSSVGGVCGGVNIDYSYTNKIANCYFDTSKYSGDAVGYCGGIIENVLGKTAEQFASGEVCYLLNKGKTDGTQAWYQNLANEGGDSYPVLKSNVNYTVYASLPCNAQFSNSELASNDHDFDENGFCSRGCYQPATLTTNKYDINGDGTNDKVYEIGNAGQLYWFAALVNGALIDGTEQKLSANAVLIADITVNTSVLNADGTLVSDVSDFRVWTPIGNYLNKYIGIFDGKTHTVSGLYFNNSKISYVGLFGNIDSGCKISNVGVCDSYFYGQYWTGGVCGFINNGAISNCYHIGPVSGSTYAGGVCGYNNYGAISYCYNTGAVSNASYAGGVCGRNYGTISNCYFDSEKCSKNAAGTDDGTVTSTEGKTTAQFASGEVCYLSNGSRSTGTTENPLVWYQNLSERGDACPVLKGNGNNTVYSNLHYTCNCVSGGPTTCYTNDNQDIHDPHSWENGFCAKNLSVCQPAVLNTDGVYEISNAGQLYWFAGVLNNEYDTYKNAYIVLTDDIVDNTGDVAGCNGVKDDTWRTWIAIGKQYSFQGTFDGQGHTINGLFGNGLIYQNNNGTIKNLSVRNSYLTEEKWVGGICNHNQGTISGCSFSGTLMVKTYDEYDEGVFYLGGICGQNLTIIENCYINKSVQFYTEKLTNGKTLYIGGICGQNDVNGKVSNCYSMENITCQTTVSGSVVKSGICGRNAGKAVPTNCYYLTGTANSGIGETVDVKGSVEAVSSEKFASGEVTYLLNAGKAFDSQAWGQQLSTDTYPVLGSEYKIIKSAKGDKDANNNDTYWATFSNLNSDATLSVPSARNLNVYNATVSSGTMTLKKRTDNQVAKGEGVLLKTDGEYVNVKANATNSLTAETYANNNLVATPATEETINAETGYTLYRLTYKNVSEKTDLGFYLGLVKDENGNVISSDGSQLKATPGKAYLEVTTEAATKPSNAAPARGFVFPADDETTGIGEIVIEGDAGISGSANANGRIYNLQGQQVTAPVKGLYIKNNKKVIIK